MLLIDRHEGCAALYGGVVIIVWGTWMRDDLLEESLRAMKVAAAEHGGPVGVLATYRLDARFPLDVNFRGNLAAVKAALIELRPLILGCACVLEFDGFLAATMKATIGVVNAIAAPTMPIKVLSRRVEALQWLLPLIRSEPRPSVREYLEAATRVDAAFARQRETRARAS